MKLCLLKKGRPAERANELERNPQNFTTPTPRFARKFSTWNLPSHAEGAYPQNCMDEQPRNQVPEMHFDKFPDPFTIQCWKTSFKTEVCSFPSFPSEAVLWNFEMLDAKILSALKNIIINPFFKMKVILEEQKAQMQDRFLRGRQIAYMIYEYFRETGAHEAVLDYSDLFRITLHGDDIQDLILDGI